jgi:hypothetical protein
MPPIAVGCGPILQKAKTDTNATEPSATEKPSAITLDPLLYRGIWLLTDGDGIIRGVVGTGVAGVRVAGAVELALGRGVTAGGGGGDGPWGRRSATARGICYISKFIDSLDRVHVRHGE